MVLSDLERGVIIQPYWYRETLLKNVSEIFGIFSALSKDRFSPQIEKNLFSSPEGTVSKQNVDFQRWNFFKETKQVNIGMVTKGVLDHVPQKFFGALRVAVFINTVDITIFINQYISDNHLRKLITISKRPQHGRLVYSGLHTFCVGDEKFLLPDLQIECKHFFDFRDIDTFSLPINSIAEVDLYTFVRLNDTKLLDFVKSRHKIKRFCVAFPRSLDKLSQLIPELIFSDEPNVHFLRDHCEEYFRAKQSSNRKRKCHEGKCLQVQKCSKQDLDDMYSTYKLVHLVASGFLPDNELWYNFVHEHSLGCQSLQLMMSF